MATGKTRVYLTEKEEPRFDPDPADLTRAQAWQSALPIPLINRIITFLNRLEAWSVYFTTAVADENIAFGPVAPVLRSWIGQYYAIILVARAGPNNGTFPNLIRLYTLWTARMDAEQLARLHGDVTGQMERARTRLAQAGLPKPGANFEE
jgi:hypothetical protein